MIERAPFLKLIFRTVVTGMAVLVLAVATRAYAAPDEDPGNLDSDKVKATPLEESERIPDKDHPGVVYSADRKLLAHVDREVVWIWSVPEKRKLQRLVPDGTPLAAAFHPDGKSVVTADAEGNLENLSTVRLWNLKSGEGRVVAKFLGSPAQFTFSPDGSLLAASSKLGFIGSITMNPEDAKAGGRTQTGGAVYVWRVSDGREMLKTDINLPDYTRKLWEYWRSKANDHDFEENKEKGDDLVAAYEEAVRKRVPKIVKFNPNGTRLIGESETGAKTIIDLESGKLVSPSKSHEESGESD